MINNPLDVSKDLTDNIFVNGLKFNIRNSEMNKERIQAYIKNEMVIEAGDKITDILDFALMQLGIKNDELTIADEHELLDWIYEIYG